MSPIDADTSGEYLVPSEGFDRLHPNNNESIHSHKSKKMNLSLVSSHPESEVDEELERSIRVDNLESMQTSREMTMVTA